MGQIVMGSHWQFCLGGEMIFMFEKKHHGFCVDKIFGIRMENGQVSKKRDKLRCCCNNSEKDGGRLNQGYKGRADEHPLDLLHFETLSYKTCWMWSMQERQKVQDDFKIRQRYLDPEALITAAAFNLYIFLFHYDCSHILKVR